MVVAPTKKSSIWHKGSNSLEHMNILDLPRDLLNYVTDFFPNAAFPRVRTGKSELRNFLNSCQGLSTIKYEVLYWTLNEKYSDYYLQYSGFREMVHSKLQNTKKQLKLTFAERTRPLNLTTLRYSNTLELSLHPQNWDLTDLASIHTLIIYESPANSDFNVLENVQRLEIYHNEGIRNVSLLGRIPHLVLVDCPLLKDISGLGKGNQFVDLSYCTKIDDVRSLSSVRIVKLCGCTQLTDVSPLASCHTVDLSDCGNLTDVCCLGQVTSLNLSGCPISNVSALQNVKELNLSYCCTISEAYSLSSVKRLDLSGCYQLRDFDCLARVEELNLSHTAVSEIDGLQQVKVLDVSFCSNLLHLPFVTLPNLKKLIIDRQMMKLFVKNGSLKKFQEKNSGVRVLQDYEAFLDTISISYSHSKVLT